MIQDYLYLIDYTKVFALGAAKAKDLSAMKLFAGYTHAILDGEMDIHRAYMARLGITPEEAETANVALDNLSYTSYMLRVAYEEGQAEVAAAILSCAVSAGTFVFSILFLLLVMFLLLYEKIQQIAIPFFVFPIKYFARSGKTHLPRTPCID